MEKYRLTDAVRVVAGRTLHQIEALRDFGTVHAGDRGGWIEFKHNLSHRGECWIAPDACVMDQAHVIENARVGDSAVITDMAWITDAAWVGGQARIGNITQVGDQAQIAGRIRLDQVRGIHIGGTAFICDDEDWLYVGPVGSRAALWMAWRTASAGIECSTGCFCGTLAQFEAAVAQTHGGHSTIRAEYAAVVALARVRWGRAAELP